jgi:hypothetical protein
MKMKNLKWMKGVLFVCAILTLGACNDDSEPTGKGEAEFEITDAPVDDANIKGVVVTVADVKVNGNSLQGFNKQTIDLKAYFEGNTKVLGSGEFDARAYENLVLVLDLNNDANGNSPGCYVLDQNNVKYQLKSTANGTTEVVLDKSWSVAKDAKTNIVMDFDLRKAIRYSDEPAAGYSFVSDNNLQAAVNVVAKAKTGTIKGSYQENNSSNADKIIVYAYKKGTFNAAMETQPQGTDNMLFANARSSAEVKQSSLSGNYFTLAFLEEGEYELHFAGYTKDTNTGRYNFEARLQSETNVDGSVGNLITVKSGITINVASSISGII